MAVHRSRFFHDWPTGTKLLLMLTAALLPLGLVIAWAAQTSVRDARVAVARDRQDDARLVAKAIEALISRNALALRVSANDVIGVRTNPCQSVSSALTGAPGTATAFSLRDDQGELLCTANGFTAKREAFLVRPGDVRIWLDPQAGAVEYRVGVNGGSATGELAMTQIAGAARSAAREIAYLSITDGLNATALIDSRARYPGADFLTQRERVADGQLRVRIDLPVRPVSIFDSLSVLLPIVMWFVAALLSWLVVRRLLIGPLGKLQKAVSEYQPGPDRLVLPERLGSAQEIRSLGASFERAVDRIEESEQQMAEALAGQRRLVREVHHRVKNNLQVIASLLNIHGRNATTPESSAAYAAIGRRVDALSVVHRNHFAEVEETRGIALRPLLVELAATMRASSPDKGQPLTIQLDADPLHTTQDAAVAVAFFVTEVAEFSMLKNPGQLVDIDLRRASELAAVLTISSAALIVEGKETKDEIYEREQFERVVGGLARQLRSPLENKVGRLSVNLPVFPSST